MAFKGRLLLLCYARRWQPICTDPPAFQAQIPVAFQQIQGSSSVYSIPPDQTLSICCGNNVLHFYWLEDCLLIFNWIFRLNVTFEYTIFLSKNLPKNLWLELNGFRRSQFTQVGIESLDVDHLHYYLFNLLFAFRWRQRSCRNLRPSSFLVRLGFIY